MKTRRHAVVVVLCASVMGAALAARRPIGAIQGTAAADMQRLRQSAAQYADAWTRGDAQALARMYTEDAERVLITGERLDGRAAIEAQFAESFIGRPEADVATITPTSIRFLAPEIAVTQGTWVISSGPDRSNSGLYLNVAVKQGSAWLSTHSIVMQPTTPGS